MSKRIFYLFACLVIISVLQMVYFYPYLPERVASHFGSGGLADGWMPKDAFIWAQLVMLLVFILFYVMACYMKLPASGKYISLPNKEYWLQDGRKQQAERYLSLQMQWFVFCTMLFLMVIMQLTINANLQHEKRLDEQLLWYAMLIYGIFMVLWTVRFYRFFLKIDNNSDR